MIRVLHVLSTLNIGSGIANFVMNYYRKLDKEEIQFDFLLFNEPEKTFTEEVTKNGSRIFYIEKPSIKTMFNYKREVYNLFKEHKGEWEAIHVHEVLVQRIVLPAAKKYGIKKRIVHAHGGNIKIGLIKRIRNAILEFNMKKNATDLVACSNIAGQAEFGSKEFVIVTNALDLNRYKYTQEQKKAIKKDLGFKDKDFVIGTVGRISELKNPLFFVRIMSKLVDKISNIRFLHIGDGEMREEFQNCISDNNLNDSFVLLGNRTDANEKMQAMECFLLPSLTEGLGIVLIEAEASGIYSIASENVPKETKVCERVEYLPLEEDVWVNRIVDIYNSGETKKAILTDYMDNSCYNINKSLQVLREIYLR